MIISHSSDDVLWRPTAERMAHPTADRLTLGVSPGSTEADYVTLRARARHCRSR